MMKVECINRLIVPAARAASTSGINKFVLKFKAALYEKSIASFAGTAFLRVPFLPLFFAALLAWGTNTIRVFFIRVKL